MEETRQNKKQKRDAGPVYPRGAIKRVRVHNFMTYTGTVTIRPGPRLNLVLGPNGTGKSSLVCALCIGLAGKTTLLGRADNLRDFVQRGCDEAWTEITLSGGPGASDMVVRRDIRQVVKDDGGVGYSSKWRLNGRDAKLEDVTSLVSSLNVQFDNLCQFLPQDRVVEFARMDPEALLEATQKAMGDGHLHTQHRRLVELSGDARTRGATLSVLQRQLAKLEADNRALERDAERFRRRQQIEARLATIRCKQVWARVSQREARVEEDERALEQAQALLQRQRDAAAQEAGPLSAARDRAKETQEKLRAMATEAGRRGAASQPQASAAQRRQLQDALSRHYSDIDSLTTRLQGLEEKRRQWQAAIAKLRADHGAKVAELRALPPRVSNQAAINAASQEAAAIRQQTDDLELDVDGLKQREGQLSARVFTLKQRLVQLDNSRSRRLQSLNMVRPGTRALHEWVEEAKRRREFKGPVHGPLALEISLRDPASHARPVEAACRGMLWDYAVTCQEDEERLQEAAKRMGGICPRVFAFKGPLDAPYLRMAGDASQYRRYGVRASLADLVEAPPLVMQVLTSGPAALASAFLADDADGGARIDELLSKTPVRHVYTPSQEHRVVLASYASDHGRQSSDLRNATVLADGGLAPDQAAKDIEEGRLTEVEAELRQVRGELAAKTAEREALMPRFTRLQARFEALWKEQRDSVDLHKSVAAQAAVLEKQLAIKQKQPDPMEQRPQLQEQLDAAVSAHFEAQMALVRATVAQWTGVRERGALELAQREAEMQVRAIEAASTDRRQREAHYADQVAKVQRMLASSRRALESARKQAELDAGPVNGERRRAMDALPQDEASLADLEAELEAEMAGISCNNPRALEEYQRRQRDIADMRARVDTDERALAALRAEIAETRDGWLPELLRVIDAVNSAFSAAFRDIGCAGEVVLFRGGGGGGQGARGGGGGGDDDEDDGGGAGGSNTAAAAAAAVDDDYARYAVHVRVKFREGEELQLLTGTRQSGGERSVSTILYLIALQGVTVTPFRVVDEINQGMDPINERKVFGQLVRASCVEGTPQCFLLTPKLLPGLEYTRDITVLQIMNGAITVNAAAAPGGGGGGVFGQQQQQQGGWDLAALLGSRSAGLLAAH